jgi:hypothetical protein
MLAACTTMTSPSTGSLVRQRCSARLLPGRLGLLDPRPASAGSGLRSRELLGLRAHRVDLHRRRIEVVDVRWVTTAGGVGMVTAGHGLRYRHMTAEMQARVLALSNNFGGGGAGCRRHSRFGRVPRSGRIPSSPHTWMTCSPARRWRAAQRPDRRPCLARAASERAAAARPAPAADRTTRAIRTAQSARHAVASPVAMYRPVTSARRCRGWSGATIQPSSMRNESVPSGFASVTGSGRPFQERDPTRNHSVCVGVRRGGSSSANIRASSRTRHVHGRRSGAPGRRSRARRRARCPPRADTHRPGAGDPRRRPPTSARAVCRTSSTRP